MRFYTHLSNKWESIGNDAPNEISCPHNPERKASFKETMILYLVPCECLPSSPSLRWYLILWRMSGVAPVTHDDDDVLPICRLQILHETRFGPLGINISFESEVGVVRHIVENLALGRHGVAGEEIFVKAGRIHCLVAGKLRFQCVYAMQ